MEREKELQKKINDLHKEYIKKSAPFIRERDALQKIKYSKEMSAFIGKCYVYQNSCGNNDKWFLYWCVKGIVDGNYLIMQFEESNYGDFQFWLKKDMPYGFRPPCLFEESIEISKEKFVNELEKFMDKSGLVKK